MTSLGWWCWSVTRTKRDLAKDLQRSDQKVTGNHWESPGQHFLVVPMLVGTPQESSQTSPIESDELWTFREIDVRLKHCRLEIRQLDFNLAPFAGISLQEVLFGGKQFWWHRQSKVIWGELLSNILQARANSCRQIHAVVVKLVPHRALKELLRCRFKGCFRPEKDGRHTTRVTPPQHGWLKCAAFFFGLWASWVALNIFLTGPCLASCKVKVLDYIDGN